MKKNKNDHYFASYTKLIKMNIGVNKTMKFLKESTWEILCYLAVNIKRGG